MVEGDIRPIRRDVAVIADIRRYDMGGVLAWRRGPVVTG